MDEPLLSAVCVELREALEGRKFGRIFALTKRQMAVDFRLPDSRYLFISVDPDAPRIYLIQRRLREIERQGQNLSPFHLLLRSRLSGSDVVNIEKQPGDRVVALEFLSRDEGGTAKTFRLVAQLTGRSSNLFLLDENATVLDSLLPSRGEGQMFGDRYQPPIRPTLAPVRSTLPVADLERPHDGSVSSTLDRFYQHRDAERRFDVRSRQARNRLVREIAKRETLVRKLGEDLVRHGEPEKWKRLGDLILANLASATRTGNTLVVTDLFDPEMKSVEIAVEENDSLTQTAEKYFRLYAKARNAGVEIRKRLDTLENELVKLNAELKRVDSAIQSRDEQYFEGADAAKDKSSRPAKKKAPVVSGARRFLSSDGFEILVGKKAVDNDQLTFRVAGPLDLWLHAADYSGSHVVVRNPDRKEIPQRTLLEAAQLAAFYSSGKKQPKAAVNYTSKKFVNKPRGAKPGLVRLASFKTILVQPVIPAAIDQRSS